LSSNDQIRPKLISSYCSVAPDSSIILSHVFQEDRFSPKVACFVEDVKRTKITCEILPQVEAEIAKRLSYASQEYIKIVRRCGFVIQRITQQPLEKSTIGKDTLQILEKAFSGIYNKTQATHYPSPADKTNALNAVRIVETALVLKIRVDLEKGSISLKQFFGSAEDLFNQKYNEFCDRKISFIAELNAHPLDERKLTPPSKRLETTLQKNCNVSKPTDVKLLSQAISRMYDLDRWYAVVSIDYTHMVNQRQAIDNSTLLTVSDPLYLVFHLDRKLDRALKPKEEADRLKIPYALFVEKPKPSYVV
jgi:hypothetical protein